MQATARVGACARTSAIVHELEVRPLPPVLVRAPIVPRRLALFLSLHAVLNRRSECFFRTITHPAGRLGRVLEPLQHERGRLYAQVAVEHQVLHLLAFLVPDLKPDLAGRLPRRGLADCRHAGMATRERIPEYT